jgi:LmbE family N-acetylglucosaminyl deacetylase
MKAGTFLAAARSLPFADVMEITEGRALVLAPHPDDESLGCGGLIAECCARGTPPVVAVLTDGAASHPHSATWPPPRLRALRQRETIAATGLLGLHPDNVVFLGYPDTRAPAEGEALAEAAERVAMLLREHGCRSVLASWRHDPHCDHLAAHRIAALAARRAGVAHRSFPVWGLTLDAAHDIPARPPSGMRLDVSRHLPAKRLAIRAHQSQHAGIIDDDPTGFQMQPGFMALFGTPEIYLDVPR